MNKSQKITLTTIAAALTVWISLAEFVFERQGISQFLPSAWKSAEPFRNATQSWGAVQIPSWPGRIDVWVRAAPLPDALVANNRQYDWRSFRDDSHVWSRDATLMAFRRCSGLDEFMQDPVACVTYVAVQDEAYGAYFVSLPEPVSQKLNYGPVGFVEHDLILWGEGRLHRHKHGTQTASVIAEDAWNASLDPARTLIVYLTSYRSGEPNLWMMSADGSGKHQLTFLKGCTPGHATAWSGTGKVIFEMACRGNEIDTMQVRLGDKSAPTVLCRSQIHDCHAAQGPAQ